MNDQFKAQKEILVSLKHEISLLHQQVDYLIRNEKSLGLLDLDVMMNRTHTIYDRLCSINVGNPPSDNEEMDIDPEMLNALFGMDNGEDEEEYYEDPDEEAETPAQEEVPTEKITDTLEGNDHVEEDKGGLDQVEEDNRQLDDNEEREDNEIKDDTEENIGFEADEEDVIVDKEDDEVIVEEPVKETDPAPSEEQDYGFIFKMESDEPEQANETIEPKEPELFNEPEQPNLFSEPEQPELFNEPEQPELSHEEQKSGFYTSGDEIEMEIPHFDFPMTEDNEMTIPEEEETDFQEEEPTPFEDIIPTQEEESSLIEEENDTFEENADSQEEELEPFEEAPTLEEEEPELQEEEFEPQEEELEPQEENLEEEQDNPEEEQDSSDDIAYEPIIFGDMEEKDDMGFEFEPVETLGDKLQHEDNNTVAAMLQNQASRNLRSSIGINDKFLFVNELFGGSMEKYNRSIGNLDDLKTLNGALIYLNELRIDLQWNSNNEAYKKLLEIVHHKFE